ncbi:hypothetical protein OG896_24615 [Streptomyces sp. NBC_00669]|uniref:hypothetical protein n=1 Tax=Streptomyces sp. NBC_00669 TaxID=2976011 RepID=UPI002E334A97|nr:hypothetical protein [Streptomyces sp. NBC_00669]
MQMPRVRCATCGRPTAAGPVAGRPGRGRLWRHDDPNASRRYSGPLVSCTGSLEIVELPAYGYQLEIGLDAEQELITPLF